MNIKNPFGRWNAALKLAVLGTVMQTSSCMFDSDAFVSESITTLYNNITTLFIITSLTDLLDVSPSF